MNLLSAPGLLWNLYVENLWYYQPGSWVYSASSTFRFLAFVVMAPFILLTLLVCIPQSPDQPQSFALLDRRTDPVNQDVTSYVIARTLGVIDDTKASTSETGATSSEVGTPSIVVQDDTGASSKPLTTPPATFFRNPLGQEGNLQLSGVGMFSPAPSQPPSPTMSRRELSTHMHNVPEEYTNEIERRMRDASRESSGGESSSGESSYAMLEHESGSEDAHVTLRRRTKISDQGSGPSES